MLLLKKSNPEPLNPYKKENMNEKMFDLSGKVAIVTGTSRGLGQYFGRALAKAGADLVITSRSLKTLDTFQKEIEYLVDRIPLKRPGSPHDLDGALVFLASDAAEYITGQTMLVDGGITTGSTRALPAQKP